RDLRRRQGRLEERARRRGRAARRLERRRRDRDQRRRVRSQALNRGAPAPVGPGRWPSGLRGSAAARGVENRNKPDRAAALWTHHVADRNERLAPAAPSAMQRGTPGRRSRRSCGSGYSWVDLVASAWRFIYRGSAQGKVHALMLKLTGSLRLLAVG